MQFKLFSWARFVAVLSKEFVQMRRDRLTFGIMIGIPVMQLVLFGYAINTNPKHLPTAIRSADTSAFTRDFITRVQNTDYFKITKITANEQQAKQALRLGETQFVINIPANFTRDLIRNKHPTILIEADATDPVTTGSAAQAAGALANNAFDHLAIGKLDYLHSKPPAANIVVHRKYNPESITQYNVVPGLLGVILTMTMAMVTAMAITKERERGTMESLLATPVRPLEVMFGKIIPYIMVGYLQIFLTLVMAHYLFAVPIMGSTMLLMFAALPFIAANLAVGLTFSSLARNQLQAMQMTFFFFMPSIMLSGFIFPFRGMPDWAQWIGSALPLTHFIRITRGIMLKGNNWLEITPEIWPMLLFMLVAIAIGLKSYRRTLD